MGMGDANMVQKLGKLMDKQDETNELLKQILEEMQRQTRSIEFTAGAAAGT